MTLNNKIFFLIAGYVALLALILYFQNLNQDIEKIYPCGATCSSN